MRLRAMGVVGACVAALAVAGCNRGGDEAAEGGEAAADGAAAGESGGSTEAPDPEGRLPADGEAGGGAIGGKPGTGAGPAAASGGAAPAAGGGNDPQFVRLISGYLDSYHQQMAAGVARAPGTQDEIASLRAGAEHRWGVQLEGGRAYGVIGACDNECSDVDLILEDPSGREVASDLLADDYPLVQVTPPSSGRYMVRIRLVTCTVEPCYVGARLIRQ